MSWCMSDSRKARYPGNDRPDVMDRRGPCAGRRSFVVACRSRERKTGHEGKREGGRRARAVARADRSASSAHESPTAFHREYTTRDVRGRSSGSRAGSLARPDLLGVTSHGSSPQCHDAFRSRLPLRGSSGIASRWLLSMGAPDSLLGPSRWGGHRWRAQDIVASVPASTILSAGSSTSNDGLWSLVRSFIVGSISSASNQQDKS